ncbi:MAG: hypothetical protein ACYCUG_06370 [Acidimicrobiales bacterium]
MILLLGLILLAAAVVVAAVGVRDNAGTAHALTHGFSVFGYQVTGSTGTLFLYGLVVGGVGVLGLSLMVAGVRRSARRGRVARQGSEHSRRKTAVVSQERADLVDQRSTARADTAAG